MKKWNLKSGDPGTFTIASDARCGSTNYTNDHIWELRLEGGEPPSLAVETTFGLRARNLRLFPRFVEGDTAIIDPVVFTSPPEVQRFFPNYLEVIYSPLTGIDVKNEYWVPASNVITGRIHVTNSRLTQRQIRVQWAALLSPTDGGQRMASQEMEAITILSGQTGGIYPLIFLTGGPELSAGPYPALSVEMDLAPGGTRQLTWVHAALGNPEESFKLARETAALSWDAEIARLDVFNGNLITIVTGDPDWDAALALAQVKAFSLFVGPTDHLPHSSYVFSRQPDQGYSSLGDGSDFGHLWDGQTPLEADFISTLLLPAAPDLVIGYLDNFLDIQSQGGFIDFKPGLAGQRSRMMATPILANLAWRIYQTTEDTSFLEEIFPKLLNFVQAWFTEGQDRDGDGLPEWARASQSGFDDHPIFSQWQPWSQGGDISKTESPSLCAFLYNEIKILIRMANIIELTSPLAALEALADNLKSAVDTSWDDSDSFYRTWDRESHFSPSGEYLGNLVGPGEIKLDREFKNPVRLAFQVNAAGELPRRISIFIHGIGTFGKHRVERIEAENFRWHIDQGNANSERIYASVEYIEVFAAGTRDNITVKIVDLSGMDQTLLLPLWAGIPDKNRAQKFINNTITNPDIFWKRYGIPACLHKNNLDEHPCFATHMIWNNLIGEGLLKYGQRERAAELVTKLMSAVIGN
jgi:hypothetical protein